MIIELFNNEPQDVIIKIFTPDTSRIIFDRRYPGIKEGSLSVNLGSPPDGSYLIQVLTKDELVTRRVRIRHDPSAIISSRNYAIIQPGDTPDDILHKAAMVIPTDQQSTVSSMSRGK